LTPMMRHFQWLSYRQSRLLTKAPACGAMAKKIAKNTWAVSIIRKRSQFLGYVEALDREATEAAAVVRFNLSEQQRGQIVIKEQA
jgi:hypothetical protein